MLPALAIYLFFESIPLQRKLKIFIGSTIISLLPLFLVNLYQYSFTKIEWGFFSAQQTYWDNHWRLPHFPLSSYGDNYILRIDLFAFYCGFIAFYLLGFHFYEKIKATYQLDSQWILIYSYLFGISLLVLLTRGGSLFSLNRFIFTSIFGGILVINLPSILRKHTVPIILMLLLMLVLNKSYVHIQVFLFQLTVLIFFLLLYFSEYKLFRGLLLILFIVYQFF